MKTKFILTAALLLACTLISCGGSPKFPTTPKFLMAIDGSGAGTNVNVFPVDATTGALGAAVAGSPFDFGLVDPMNIEVHPNGKYVYVSDGSDGSIHAISVSEKTGVATAIGAKVVNESGSFLRALLWRWRCGNPRACGHSERQVPV